VAYIILADDDDLVCDIVKETFREYGHVVGCVSNGEDALKVLAAKKPDLVILDCAMPNLSGLLTLRRIRVSKDLYSMPVLMLTANRGKEDVKLALREGADGYVKKPFDPHRLVFSAEAIIKEKKLGWDRGLPGSVMATSFA